jgi:hypothetical protein
MIGTTDGGKKALEEITSKLRKMASHAIIL